MSMSRNHNFINGNCNFHLLTYLTSDTFLLQNFAANVMLEKFILKFGEESRWKQNKIINNAYWQGFYT